MVIVTCVKVNVSKYKNNTSGYKLRIAQSGWIGEFYQTLCILTQMILLSVDCELSISDFGNA